MGSGSSYSRAVSTTDPAFELRVAVTSVGITVADTHLVDVIGGTPPLSVNITGPSYAFSGDYLAWNANATGGTGSYTYQWQFRFENSTTWTNVGTGASYSRSAPLRSFYLCVIVTSGSETASDDHYVYVEYYREPNPCSPYYRCVEP